MAEKIVICDTDILIDYWDKESKRHSTSRNLLEDEIGLNHVALSVITCMELINGARNKQELSSIRKDLDRFIQLHLTLEISKTAFQLFEIHKLSHGLEIADCLIGATSKITQLELLTYNQKDYRFIEGLALYPL